MEGALIGIHFTYMKGEIYMAEFDNNNSINDSSNTYNNEANNFNNDTFNNSANTVNDSVSSNNAGSTSSYNNYNLPDYSFWAEQIQANSQPSSNQGQGGVNSANFNYQQQGNNTAGSYQPQGNWQGEYQQQYSYSNNPNSNNTNNSYQSYQYNNTNPPFGNYYSQYGNPNNFAPKKDKKPGFFVKSLKFAGKAVCFGLIAGIGFFGFHKVYSIINPEASIKNVIEALDNQDSAYQISYTKPATISVSDKSIVNKVIDNNLPSIVSISSTATRQSYWFGQQQVSGSGSGIIVGKTEKEILIATNNHVVEGADEIVITFVDGKEAKAVIKGTDVAADLAVVALDIEDIDAETLNKITVAKLGNSDDVKVGEMAIAIGNALGYGQSATVGYISAKDREVEVSDGNFKTKKMILLQTDAAINPGNSGGALLNSKGEVIGINSVKYANEEVEGMGFAIPISKAIPIINELMSREILSEEEQGFLGISGGDVTEDASKAYNMPVGVFVNELVEGGPAQKAGLNPGDIIIKVDDITVTSIQQLREYVSSRRVGTDVKVTFMRYENGSYNEYTVTVTLGKNPNLDK